MENRWVIEANNMVVEKVVGMWTFQGFTAFNTNPTAVAIWKLRRNNS
jgi:hypothetical protein